MYFSLIHFSVSHEVVLKRCCELEFRFSREFRGSRQDEKHRQGFQDAIAPLFRLEVGKWSKYILFSLIHFSGSQEVVLKRCCELGFRFSREFRGSGQDRKH